MRPRATPAGMPWGHLNLPRGCGAICQDLRPWPAGRRRKVMEGGRGLACPSPESAVLTAVSASPTRGWRVSRKGSALTTAASLTGWCGRGCTACGIVSPWKSPRTSPRSCPNCSGVLYDGWNPSRVPLKYGRPEYVARFAREARIHESDVPKASAIVTATVRHHVSAGAVDGAFECCPATCVSCWSRRCLSRPSGASRDQSCRGREAAVHPGRRRAGAVCLLAGAGGSGGAAWTPRAGERTARAGWWRHGGSRPCVGPG